MQLRHKKYKASRLSKRFLGKGISLIEILIVITVFAALGIVVTESIVLSLQGSKKSENLVSVRENVDYASGVMERQFRNANSIVDCASQPSDSSIDYLDQNGNSAFFTLVNNGTDSYISSGSAQLNLSSRLTSDKVNITSFSVKCNAGQAANPDYIDINITAQSAAPSSGPQKSSYSVSTRVYLRNY